MTERSTNYKGVQKVLIYTLVLNIFVTLAKIIYGTITKSASMVADGYHSFSDATSNIVGLVGIWISSKPADECHPYGHQKVETLSTIFISVILFFVSFEIASGAYARFKNPITPNIDKGNFIVMVITLVINVFVVIYETKKGKELKSSFLISDAKHTKSDIYVSLSVIISLISVKLGYILIDSIISIIIAGFIVKAGLEILLEGINVLIDGQMLDPEKVYNIVNKHPEVKYCHKVRTRGKENHIMIDLHVGVDESYTIKHAHEIAHEVEDMVKKNMGSIRDVIVHVEPAKLINK